jgi:hypothetical protein
MQLVGRVEKTVSIGLWALARVFKPRRVLMMHRSKDIRICIGPYISVEDFRVVARLLYDRVDAS